jgi:hypothetical protein
VERKISTSKMDLRKALSGFVVGAFPDPVSLLNVRSLLSVSFQYPFIMTDRGRKDERALLAHP